MVRRWVRSFFGAVGGFNCKIERSPAAMGRSFSGCGAKVKKPCASNQAHPSVYRARFFEFFRHRTDPILLRPKKPFPLFPFFDLGSMLINKNGDS